MLMPVLNAEYAHEIFISLSAILSTLPAILPSTDMSICPCFTALHYYTAQLLNCSTAQLLYCLSAHQPLSGIKPEGKYCCVSQLPLPGLIPVNLYCFTTDLPLPVLRPGGNILPYCLSAPVRVRPEGKHCYVIHLPLPE